MDNLVGIGLYTPAEAGRLLRIQPQKISRWLRGHQAKKKSYAPLWTPEVNLGDGRVFLGFRDLMEIRVAAAFIDLGVSAIKVRAAVINAREIIGQDHPLSTNRFLSDGREIFLRILEIDDSGVAQERLVNLFRRQYEFKTIVEPILKSVDFDSAGTPFQWWPGGRKLKVVIDPARSFGQPIDLESKVPTAILSTAAAQEGVRGAARSFDVPVASIRRAVAFEAELIKQDAA